MFYGIKVRKVRNPILIFSTLHQNPPKKKYVFSTSFSPAFGSFYVLFPARYMSCFRRYSYLALLERFFPPLLSRFRLVICPVSGAILISLCSNDSFRRFVLCSLRPNRIWARLRRSLSPSPPSSLFPSVAFLPPLDSLYCADCQSAFPLPPFPPPLGGRGALTCLHAVNY